jgi:hypothetical protein
MGDLPLVGRTNLRSRQRDNGHRLAINGGKFYLVPFAPLMNQHNGSDVASLKPVPSYTQK